MEEIIKISLSEKEKTALLDKLTPELPLLRTEANISQEEIANIIGVSRQTYGAIERKVRKMSWNTYLSLILFYDYNKKTHAMIREHPAFPHELIKRFNEGEEPSDFELGLLFESDIQKILDSLDEQAFGTLKTVLMVEYSRCNKVPGDEVVRFFQGLDFRRRGKSKTDTETKLALNNIRRISNNEQHDN